MTEWKNGDVVLSRGQRGLVTTSMGEGDQPEYVELANGDTLLLGELPDDARRLAVVDFGDLEEVERLVRLLPVDWNLAGFLEEDPETLADSISGVAAALRAFANPDPSAPEPTETGAMVEDANGDLWVRAADGRWLCLDGGSSYVDGYAKLDVARQVGRGRDGRP